MKKTAAAIAALVVAVVAAHAAPSNAARVDVTPTNDAVELSAIKAEGGSAGPQGWQKDEAKKKQTLSSNFPAGIDWKKAVVTFTPLKDGKVNILFMGQWSKEEEDRSWALIDGIQAEGAELVNGNFEDGLQGWWLSGKKQAALSDIAKSGAKAVKANHDNGVGQTVSVKANVPVTISFWQKLAD